MVGQCYWYRRYLCSRNFTTHLVTHFAKTFTQNCFFVIKRMVPDIFTGKSSCVKMKLLKVPRGSNVYKQKPKKPTRYLNLWTPHEIIFVMSNLLHLCVMLTWNKTKKSNVVQPTYIYLWNLKFILHTLFLSQWKGNKLNPVTLITRALQPLLQSNSEAYQNGFFHKAILGRKCILIWDNLESLGSLSSSKARNAQL